MPDRQPPSADRNASSPSISRRDLLKNPAAANLPHRPATTDSSTKIPERHDHLTSVGASQAGNAGGKMAGDSKSNPSATPTESASKATNMTYRTGEAHLSAGLSAPQIRSIDATASPLDEQKSQTSASSQKLNDYRERLARDLERRELSARGLLLNSSDKRVSPIQEEALSMPPALNTASTNVSTESGNTIRGGMTPANVASTPSYPFPRMASGLYSYKPLTSPLASGFRSSPMPSFEPSTGAHDRVMSNDSTPAASFTFNPTGYPSHPGVFDFPEPNLYELSLMLAAEPGLDAWWNTVVQIMKDVYKAERVTLAVPADTTDIENVPWGQKATYNEHQEDEFSLAYMGRSSSVFPVSDIETPNSFTNREESLKAQTPMRPELYSRHSFTSYEDNKGRSQERPSISSRRPSHLTRSRSYWPQGPLVQGDEDQQQLSKGALEEHDSMETDQSIPAWESPFPTAKANRGRVLPVLQALSYEADPLIDHAGIIRVLERGKTVTLTRTYPYLENTASHVSQRANVKQPSTGSSMRPNKSRSDSMSKRSSIFGSSTSSRGSSRSKPGPSEKGKAIGASLDDEGPRPPTPKYEEYEQAPPSPWSQSPAPSPAVRTDTKENPFFADATVDEDSFNPSSDPADYTGIRPPEAIGIDNSWTVLHIPLTHILLSRPNRSFELSGATTGAKAQSDDKDGSVPGDRSAQESSPEGLTRTKAAPIAILSILTPVIPYPSNLRHSLEHLAPHMATSFSLCRHYDNLETELAGLQRRRPSTTGFGAVAPDGRPLNSTTGGYLSGPDSALQASHTGSMTSPSEYSGVSKSITGSPAGTPGWEQVMADKRQQTASPAAMPHCGEGYFSSKQRSGTARHDTLGSGPHRRDFSKDNSSSDKWYSRLSVTKGAMEGLGGTEAGERLTSDVNDTALVTPSIKSPSRGLHSGDGTPEDSKEKTQETPRHERGHSQGHTMLHSYGADFASTFQSLPPSSMVSRPPPLASTQGRSLSYASSAVDMPPPSDKLKGLMLDALPAHVFVALPQTGEIVWVNSRYLSYRGQTVADLAEDPWSSIHPDDCDEYLKAWGHSLRTGEQFSRTVRIKRFDGQYRWFYARAVASKDKRGVIMQFLGSYMDIHDQHIAELKAARQEEIEASEAKHRLLANLIPQIIFTATEEDGITFANEQWLSYTGQSFDDSLGLGFLDFVHPEDLAKCRIPTEKPMSLFSTKSSKRESPAQTSSPGVSQVAKSPRARDESLRSVQKALSRHSSSGTSSIFEVPSADLTELAKRGIIKVGTDTNGRLSYTTELRLRSKTGEYRWHLIRCVEIDTIDFGSGASSYFGSATDINDHKILETKLKEAMEAKGRFLSNMSHEIRTPLIGISGMVSFLQDTVLNEEQRDYTNTIQTSANSLIMIINDILDLSKVDAGMMKLKFEWFHTSSLIEDVNELVSTMAIAKGLELNYLVEADVPPWVKGDKVRIRQVLLNVIGNAIKFTAKGEVFSHCRVFNSHEEDSEIMLEYAIIDTGQGFTQQEAELIFKPFSQIDGSSTRQYGGSGLGLVISKQLVELHGGTMGGTATPGKGSKFVFTARFALPTDEDHPDLPISPAHSTTSRQASSDSVPGNFQPLPPPIQSHVIGEGDNTGSESAFTSPAVASTGSSNPSMLSGRSQTTDRSSVTSVNAGLARFSEAAKASGQDLSQMKLEMPSGRSSPGRTMTPSSLGHPPSDGVRPPMYSILVICPQKYSLLATTQHIEMTIPSDVPHQITALGSAEEAQKVIGGEDPIKFTHVVINLGSAEAVLSLMDQISKSQKIDKTTILILSDSVQRQAVIKLAANTPHEKLLSENRVTFIYKPVKPSRFAVIFDPDNMRDLSIDRNRSTAQQMVETQKASYMEIEKRMGNKGYKVLLVEDNPVNQKVLDKYLKKIGVAVDVAVDGAECTEMVLSKPHDQYSLILCDLHMPRKDGYQACREIRQWEKSAGHPSMPIIALSANVMSDVHDKCVAAGFSDYVTKPVDFIDLSRAMAKFF